MAEVSIHYSNNFSASRKSKSNTTNSDSSKSKALLVYVPYAAWLQSVLEGNSGRVEVSSVTVTRTIEAEAAPVVEEVENVVEEDFSQYEFQDDLVYLRSLDPKEWKEQDHYAVLGIKDLRHRATEDVIKRACK